MVSTKSAHLLPDNSPEAFNGFYCTWKPVKFRWKHFNVIRKAKKVTNQPAKIEQEPVRKPHIQGFSKQLYQNSTSQDSVLSKYPISTDRRHNIICRRPDQWRDF